MAFTVSGDDSKIGNITAGVIKRGQRKNDEGVTNSGVSKNLMRFVLSILLAEYKCEKITTMPISDRGRGYDRSNGFFDTKSKVLRIQLKKI